MKQFTRNSSRQGEARRDPDAIEAVFRKLNARPLLLVADELCLSPLNKSTALCLEGRVPFDRPFHVPQGGFRAVAVNVVNGGRDQIVINETAEGPPGVVDQIDRVVDTSSKCGAKALTIASWKGRRTPARNSFSSKRGVRTVLGQAWVRKSR
jgi:hypothetical protein